jgi:hypothetical protein
MYGQQNIKSENPSKMSLYLYQATRRHIQNYGRLHLPYLLFENICKPGQLKRYIDYATTVRHVVQFLVQV